jgi:hypothetical protein
MLASRSFTVVTASLASFAAETEALVQLALTYDAIPLNGTLTFDVVEVSYITTTSLPRTEPLRAEIASASTRAVPTLSLASVRTPKALTVTSPIKVCDAYTPEEFALSICDSVALGSDVEQTYVF